MTIEIGPTHPVECGWNIVFRAGMRPPTWEDCTCDQRLSQQSFDAVKRMQPTKHDGEKVRYDLIPVTALDEVATVFTFGAKKYDDYNYLGLDKWRLFCALLRHAYAWARGEDADDETGLSHLAHCVCCAMMLRHQETKEHSANRIDSPDH